VETTLNLATNNATRTARFMAYPLVRIILGIVLTFVAVPLTMGIVSKLVEKPYRMVWPQLLAAVLVWCGYRFHVRRIERREPTELSTQGMGRQLGLGLLIGVALVTATFGVLAALGVYRFAGFNAPGWMLLVPLAELVLVGMAEEMVFRGVIFGVTEKALGAKWAVVISALLFSLAHLPNDGMSALAVAVIAAYGVLQALLYLKTRRLWACIGTHIAWNYCVSQVFSSTVSGHSANAGLMRGELVGNPMLTGGVFGVEASVVTLLLIGAAACLMTTRRGYAATTPGTR
jgi:hypothetical protein